MKSGANKTNQARIVRLATGNKEREIKPMTVKQISLALNIDEACVKAFMPKKSAKSKAA